MSKDIYHSVELSSNLPIDNANIFNRCLQAIKEIVLGMGGQSLTFYGLPEPVPTIVDLDNREYICETNYNVNSLNERIDRNELLLTEEQSEVYKTILQNVGTGIGKIFFLDAPRGTGKTFVLNLLLANIRKEKGIALAVASSGIVATLLDGGRTAHATFKLPLNLTYNETPVCNISKQSNMAKVLQECKLIVWDESTMAHKRGLEALDRTLRDLRGNDRLMGGVTVLLAGDFRQILPVVTRGTKADEIKAYLKSSSLWLVMEQLSLRTNMRVRLGGDVKSSNFANILLKIGNGVFPGTDSEILINSDLAIDVDSLDDLIQKIYPEISELANKTLEWLCERAILTPKNEDASLINNYLLKAFDAQEMIYKSFDTVLQLDDAVNFPVEFLNTLNPPGLPPHKLVLKIGSPVILLRNLSPPKLCNGTRLKIVDLQRNIIEATIITGPAREETVFIPRILLIPSDYDIEFKRVQFPLKLCFAMTINKAQGQTPKMARIDLRNHCFSHGQLYVACSRVSAPSNLVILTPERKTKNIVYREVL